MPTEKQQVVTTAGFDLSYLPADADVIVHVDVAKLRKSKLWSTYSHDIAKLLAPGFSGCAYEPLSNASSVEIGIPADTGPTMFVVRGIDRDQTLTCFKTANRVTAATFDGDYVTLTGPIGTTRVATFVDKTTLVMQTTKEPTKQTLQQAVQAGAPLRKNAEFVVALNRATKSAGVIAASRPGSAKLAATMKTSGVTLGFFTGWIDLDTRFELHYAMEVASPTEATTLASTMKAQFDTPQVKQMFDGIESKAQDKTVTLDVTLGETKLATLVGMVRSLIPES